jgi:DNA-binding NarL/FixJ family response regulator
MPASGRVRRADTKESSAHGGAPSLKRLRQRQVVSYAAFGHSLKFIAYELGLGSATVSRHLKDALRKLGLRSRHELLNDFAEPSVRKP